MFWGLSQGPGPSCSPNPSPPFVHPPLVSSVSVRHFRNHKFGRESPPGGMTGRIQIQLFRFVWHDAAGQRPQLSGCTTCQFSMGSKVGDTEWYPNKLTGDYSIHSIHAWLQLSRELRFLVHFSAGLAGISAHRLIYELKRGFGNRYRCPETYMAPPVRVLSKILSWS